MAVLRRLPLDAAVAVVLPATVLLFAFGSSSVAELVRVGSPGRWAALLVLAALALARLGARGVRMRSLPAAWALAAALLLVGADSVLWSVDVHATAGRLFTLGVLFVAAAALALGGPVSRTFDGVLAGVALVALSGLVVLLVSHREAVAPASAGAGWRFQGVGQNPNTVPMLLAIGLPVALWHTVERSGRARLLGAGLVLLFAGEIAASGSRDAILGGFAGAAVCAAALGRTPRAKAALVAAAVALGAVTLVLSRLPAPAAAGNGVAAAAAAAAPLPRHRGIDAQQVFRLDDEIGHPPAGSYSPPVRRTVFGSSGRAEAWSGAWKQGLQRPVAGYGFGTESSVFVDRFYSFEGAFVEDSYLGLFLQLGAVGTALFAALLLALAWAGVRAAGAARTAAAALGVLVAAILLGVGQSGLLSTGNIAAVTIWVCVLALPALAQERRRAS